MLGAKLTAGEQRIFPLERDRTHGALGTVVIQPDPAIPEERGHMKMTGKLGAIKTGGFADILVVNGNPLEDLALLYEKGRGPDLIIKGGKIVSDKRH